MKLEGNLRSVQLVAEELTWTLWRTALNRLDAFVKVKDAIEARDREVVEVCAVAIEKWFASDNPAEGGPGACVRRALATPSPETGTAAVPTRECATCGAPLVPYRTCINPDCAGPAAEPVKPPATCQCFHAPEQHHRETGCGVVAIMSGRCPCEWNGARTPAAGIAPTPEEGRFRCICPDKAKCPNCEWSCLYCRCERGTRP